MQFLTLTLLRDHKEKVQKIIKEQEALDESIKMYESKLNNISEIIEKKRQISQDLDVQFQVKKLQLETELRAALTELEQGEAALKAEQASYDAALCESKMLEMPMDQADKKSAVVKRLREKLAERKSKSAQLQSQFDNGKKINTTLAAAVQLTDAQVAEQEELSFEGARNIAALSDKRTNIKNRMKQVAQLAQDIDKNPGELAQLTNMDDFGKIQREQQQFQQLKATKKKQIEDELSKQEEIKQENAILQAEHVQHIQHLEGLKQSTGEVENRIIVKRQQADEKRKAIEAENEKLKMEIVEVKAKIGDRMASSNKKKQEQVAKIKKLKEKISDERLKSFAQEAAANGAEKKSNEDSEIDINNLSISMPMHNVSNAFSSSSDDDWTHRVEELKKNCW